MRVLALVLARGGSERCPKKNLTELGGVPLAKLAENEIRNTPEITDSFILTDSKEIAASCGLTHMELPADLCGPNSPIEEAAAFGLITAENLARANGIERPEYDYVVSLQCAVPVRPKGAISALINAVKDTGALGGVTVIKRQPWTWTCYGDKATTWWSPVRYPRTQDLDRTDFEEINSIQVAPRNIVAKHFRHRSPLVLMEIPSWADVDIDYPADVDSAKVKWDFVKSQLDEQREFPYRLVHHTWNPPLNRFPLAQPWGENLTGVILGNSTFIDGMTEREWRSLEHPGLITLGINRLCASVAAKKYNFAPTLHMVWDRWPEHTRTQINEALKRLHGRTWRICSNDSASVLEHDQAIASTTDVFGPPIELRMRYASLDGGCNLLYRLGCRKIYVIGCDYVIGGNPARCEVPWEETASPCAQSGWVQPAIDAMKDVAAYPGLELFSPIESELTKQGVTKIGWPKLGEI